jgi:hypothetical protein
MKFAVAIVTSFLILPKATLSWDQDEPVLLRHRDEVEINEVQKIHVNDRRELGQRPKNRGLGRKTKAAPNKAKKASKKAPAPAPTPKCPANQIYIEWNIAVDDEGDYYDWALVRYDTNSVDAVDFSNHASDDKWYHVISKTSGSACVPNSACYSFAFNDDGGDGFNFVASPESKVVFSVDGFEKLRYDNTAGHNTWSPGEWISSPEFGYGGCKGSACAREIGGTCISTGTCATGTYEVDDPFQCPNSQVCCSTTKPCSLGTTAGTCQDKDYTCTLGFLKGSTACPYGAACCQNP